MIRLSIDLEDSRVRYFLATAPNKIFNAQRSAIRTTTTFADRLLKQKMVTAMGLPAKVFKVYRIFAKASDQKGVIWLGMNPIQAVYAGKMTQYETGAMAGKYFWQGGFIAKVREEGASSGYTSIFKRKGSKSFPIIEQKVELPIAKMLVEDVAGKSQLELQRRFVEKLMASM